MIIPGRKAVLKRIPTRIDRTDDIQRYDTDNLYPQRAKELMFPSYSLSGIIPRLSSFLNGEGFRDKVLAEEIVYDNGKGFKIKAKDLLDNSCSEKSWIDSIAWHVGYDLNYNISHIKPIPFEYCRLGLQDDNGDVNTIAYSTNWEQDYSKENKTREVTHYPVFNPLTVAEEIESCGGIGNYKGQIYYKTPIRNQYPKATFDAVFELAQTQAEISIYALNNVVNGFSAGHIMIYNGKFQDDTQRTAFKNKIDPGKGGRGAGSVLVIETGTDNSTLKANELFVKTELQNNDKLFEFTLGWIEKAILQNFGMPPEIMGKMPESGMFNRQQIEEAYTYFNSVVSDKRTFISRAFEEVFSHWKNPVFKDFAILPQRYISEGAPVPHGTQAPNEAQTAIDGIIRSLSRRDVSKIYKYVEDYRNGRATIEQTKAFLKPFLQTDENVNLFLQDPEGDGADTGNA